MFKERIKLLENYWEENQYWSIHSFKSC